MTTLEIIKFNLITAVYLAEFERDRNHTDRISSNALVLVDTCYGDYIQAGGKKYTLGSDTFGDPFLIVINPEEEL